LRPSGRQTAFQADDSCREAAVITFEFPGKKALSLHQCLENLSVVEKVELSSASTSKLVVTNPAVANGPPQERLLVCTNPSPDQAQAKG
jgi:hypothetical protein